MNITDEMLAAYRAGRHEHRTRDAHLDGANALGGECCDRAGVAGVAPIIAAQALQPVQRGVQDALDWVAREYRQCIVAARCTHDHGHYERANGRAEAYRQLGTLVATAAGLPGPDWEAIKAEVPSDGIYR
jgi:hypothetical protein